MILSVEGIGEITADGRLQVDLMFIDADGAMVRVNEVDQEPSVEGLTVTRPNGAVEFIPWPRPDEDSDAKELYYEMRIPR